MKIPNSSRIYAIEQSISRELNMYTISASEMFRLLKSAAEKNDASIDMKATMASTISKMMACLGRISEEFNKY